MGYLIFLFLLVAAVTFLLAWLDGRRVEAYIASIGGELLELVSPGMFLRSRSPLYQVTFKDRDGVVRKAVCTTSILNGTFLREEP